MNKNDNKNAISVKQQSKTSVPKKGKKRTKKIRERDGGWEGIDQATDGPRKK